MLDRLTEQELRAWIEFNKTNPITDHRRLYVPAALIASAMGADFQKAIDFLHPKPKDNRPLKPAVLVRSKKE